MKDKNKALIITSTTITVLSVIFALLSLVKFIKYINTISYILLCLVCISLILITLSVLSNDKAIAVLSIVISLIICVLTFSTNKVLTNLDDILGKSIPNIQTLEGVYVSYNDNKYKSIEEFSNKKLRVGAIKEEYNGITSIGLENLESVNTDIGAIYYNDIDSLFEALINDDCDVVIVSNDYQELLSDELLKEKEDFHEFGLFSDDVDTNKEIEEMDISLEPFNVLLMGYSRTDIGSTVGLTDAIIVATINPKTYTISLISIPRDSFVEIPCYNNEKMKINAGREESIECFVDTVEALLGMEIEFYLESDYDGIVNVVDTLGGIWIDNPVEFNLDGVTVPKGHLKAPGYMVLQFCRERHHMPNGDFDRQKHQREVIQEIVKEMISSDDVMMTLKCLDAASPYVNTNLTYKQICQIFELVKKTTNNTGLKTYKLIDIQNSRVTGYASWHYSKKFGFDLWIYRLYKGSVQECIDQINKVLGKNIDTSNQVYEMTFNIKTPYERPLFYHEKFDEVQNHDKYD